MAKFKTDMIVYFVEKYFFWYLQENTWDDYVKIDYILIIN